MSLSNLIAFTFIFFALSNCSSSKKTKSLTSNQYYSDFKDITEDIQSNINSSPDIFIEWALKKTLQTTKKTFNERPILSQLPQVRLHGMLTPTLLKLRENNPIVFTRTENSHDGNPMWDVLSLEISAQFIAKNFRFNSYKSGSCLKAYQNQMTTLIDKHEIPSLIISSTFGGTPIELEDRLSTPDIDPKVFSSIKKAFSKDVIKGQNIANPFHPTLEPITLLKLDDESLWRLAPLSFLQNCSDYRKTLSLFSAKTKIHCLKTNKGINYLIEEITKADEYFQIGNFLDASQLEPLVYSMCTQLAFRHSLQLSQKDRQKLFLLVAKNPTLPGLIKRLTDEHSEEILDAYRASLL